MCFGGLCIHAKTRDRSPVFSTRDLHPLHQPVSMALCALCINAPVIWQYICTEVGAREASLSRDFFG